MYCVCFLYRLSLTPTPREKRTRSHTQQSASKRVRLDTSLTQSQQETSSSSDATGDIRITKVDTEGRYIEIKNVSDNVSGLRYPLTEATKLCRTMHLNTEPVPIAKWLARLPQVNFT